MIHCILDGDEIHSILDGDGDITVLILASYIGDTESVRVQLTTDGVNVDATSEQNHTALMCASFMGHANIVGALLEAGAELYTMNKHGKTALDYAISQNHTEIVHMLGRLPLAMAAAESADADAGAGGDTTATVALLSGVATAAAEPADAAAGGYATATVAPLSDVANADGRNGYDYSSSSDEEFGEEE